MNNQNETIENIKEELLNALLKEAAKLQGSVTSEELLTSMQNAIHYLNTMLSDPRMKILIEKVDLHKVVQEVPTYE